MHFSVVINVALEAFPKIRDSLLEHSNTLEKSLLLMLVAFDANWFFLEHLLSVENSARTIDRRLDVVVIVPMARAFS